MIGSALFPVRSRLMKRGEVWTVSGGAPYAGKPLITTVPKARLGKRIGKLNDEDVVRLNRALTVFSGPEIPEFYRSALSYESLYPNHAPT